jgi:hypothetical protein
MGITAVWSQNDLSGSILVLEGVRRREGGTMSKPSRLPARVPYGTKYVLENDGAIVRRFVEFPSGRKVRLTNRKALTCSCAEQQTSIVPDKAADLIGTQIFRRRIFA